MINLNENPEAILEAQVDDKFVLDNFVFCFGKTLAGEDSIIAFSGKFKDDYYLVRDLLIAPEPLDYLYFRRREDRVASMTKQEILDLLKSGKYSIDGADVESPFYEPIVEDFPPALDLDENPEAIFWIKDRSKVLVEGRPFTFCLGYNGQCYLHSNPGGEGIYVRGTESSDALMEARQLYEIIKSGSYRIDEEF